MEKFVNQNIIKLKKVALVPHSSKSGEIFICLLGKSMKIVYINKEPLVLLLQNYRHIGKIYENSLYQ